MKFADVLILVSDGREEIQEMLNGLASYCKKNHLKVNTKKTKVMLFKKVGSLGKRKMEVRRRRIRDSVIIQIFWFHLSGYGYNE